MWRGCQTPARLSAPSMHSEDPFPIISSSGISIGSSHGGDRDLHGLLVSKKAPRITRMCLQSSASKKLQRGVHPPRATGLQGMYQCISVSFPVQAMLSSTYCVPHSVQIPNPYKRLVTHVVELERRFKEESGPWAAGISASIRDAMLGSMHCSSYYEGKTFHCYSCNQGRVVLKKVQRGIHGLVQESTTYHGIMIKGTQCSFKEMVLKGRNKNHLQR